MLDCFKKTFCDCIIPTIPFSTHALGCFSVISEKVSHVIGSILYSSIGMKNHSRDKRSCFTCVILGFSYGIFSCHILT